MPLLLYLGQQYDINVPYNQFNCQMIPYSFRVAAALSSALLFTAGCSILGGKDAEPRLVIQNKNLTLVVGDTSTLAVVLGEGVPPASTSSAGFGGNLEVVKQIQWSVRDTSIARVDARGVISATQVGATYALASVDNATDSTRLAVVAPLTAHPEFIAIGAGAAHACALVAAGAVYCWGSNFLGELGQGTTDRYALTVSPTAVAATPSFVSLAVGYYHNCALTADGAAFCWGDNSYGQLGRSSPNRSGVPVKVETTHRFVSLAAGAHTTCGLTTNRTVVCWGRNLRTPVEFSAASDGGYTAVAVGSAHQCALSGSGQDFVLGQQWVWRIGPGHEYPCHGSDEHRVGRTI